MPSVSVRHRTRSPPRLADVTLGEVEVLQPDPAQDRDGRHVTQPTRRGPAVDGHEQLIPLRTDLLGAGAARRLALWDVEVVDGAAVALDPGRIGVRAQPVRCSDSQGIQCSTQCLDGAAKAVEAAHCPKDVGGVGALAPALGQEAAFAAEVEQGVEQQSLGGADYETGAELAQDRGVEAGVG